MFYEIFHRSLFLLFYSLVLIWILRFSDFFLLAKINYYHSFDKTHTIIIFLMNDLNSSDGISEPQSCYKCNDLPEDILMLACNHDLCLECAAKRLSLESKRRPATVYSFKLRGSFVNFVVRKPSLMRSLSWN